MSDPAATWTDDPLLNYADFKNFVEYSLSFSGDALHVMVGVAIQLLAAWLLRSSIGRIGPWAVVLTCELANEALDLSVERWPDFSMQLGEGAKDIAITMALPTLLLLAARFKPALFWRADPEPVAEPTDGPPPPE